MDVKKEYPKIYPLTNYTIIGSLILAVFSVIQLIFIPYLKYRFEILKAYDILFVVISVSVFIYLISQRLTLIKRIVILGSFLLIIGQILSIVTGNSYYFIGAVILEIIAFSGVVSIQNKMTTQLNTASETALKNETTFSVGTSNVGGTWDYGQVVQGMTSSVDIDDEKIDSDILVVRFLGAAEIGIVSCIGEDLDESTNNEVTLYVNTSDQLMCKDNDDDAEVLDEGVEFLEVLYGTEDDYRYFTASEVTDWADVNRVKIGLLLSTEVSAHGLTNSNSYTIFNQTIDAANDTNYRSVVMETVLIGNQGG